MTAELAVETPWRRLDPRMLIVTPIGMIVRLFPAFVILLITGGGNGDTGRLIGTGVAIVLIVALGVVRWRTTRYRITPASAPWTSPPSSSTACSGSAW